LTFLPFEDQSTLGFRLASELPVRHYARKNLGYLHAMAAGAGSLFDTDDDNVPHDDWTVGEATCSDLLSGDGRFVNAYRHFTDAHVWPRGFPLDEVLAAGGPRVTNALEPHRVGVWQSLVDGDPDVDAVYRLALGAPVQFERKPPVAVARGAYTPLNSQATSWSAESFPLLYLPSTVEFRFTDILRGYVAQRLLWERDLLLGVRSPNVTQERNEHDLLEDFRGEVECYLAVKPVVDTLNSLELGPDLLDGLGTVYGALAEEGLVRRDELDLVALWIDDCRQIART